jgi:hypothetical protein
MEVRLMRCDSCHSNNLEATAEVLLNVTETKSLHISIEEIIEETVKDGRVSALSETIEEQLKYTDAEESRSLHVESWSVTCLDCGEEEEFTDETFLKPLNPLA